MNNTNNLDMHELLDLIEAVDNFSYDMIEKLRQKAEEGKRGWNDPNWDIEDIKQQLIEHAEKEDFIDVANFAMFAWCHQQLNAMASKNT